MCTLIVRVSLLIVLQFINVTLLAVQSSEFTENGCDTLCDKGEFIVIYNCTCQQCPPGFFNNRSIHRDLVCAPHSNLFDKGCSLEKNGTKFRDNKWDCSTVKPTTITTTPIHNITVDRSSQSGSLPASLAQGAPWSLVIGLSTVVICVIVISTGASVLWCCQRRRKRRREMVALTPTTEPML